MGISNHNQCNDIMNTVDKNRRIRNPPISYKL